MNPQDIHAIAAKPAQTHAALCMRKRPIEMPLPNMKQVLSSHVKAVGYDDDEQTLYVEYSNGKISKYAGVPPDLADKVSNSYSIGKALNEHIKGSFDHEYHS